MIKFGILGLGRVVKSRIFDVFKKESKKLVLLQYMIKIREKILNFQNISKLKQVNH